jgi:hypothetical protein
MRTRLLLIVMMVGVASLAFPAAAQAQGEEVCVECEGVYDNFTGLWVGVYFDQCSSGMQCVDCPGGGMGPDCTNEDWEDDTNHCDGGCDISSPLRELDIYTSRGDVRAILDLMSRHSGVQVNYARRSLQLASCNGVVANYPLTEVMLRRVGHAMLTDSGAW